MSFALGICFPGDGTARHFFAISFLQKLLGWPMLITCVEVWLVKIPFIEKTPTHATPIEGFVFSTPLVSAIVTLGDLPRLVFLTA